VIRIEIGRRHYLLYLLLPHRLKVSLLSEGSRAKLDRINEGFNERIYSGAGATGYDQIHRYAEADQHEYPARALVDDGWGPGGFGRAIELGAGSGYFTVRIARRAHTVLAVEPVADLRDVLVARCRAEGVHNVELVDVTAQELSAVVPAGTVDTAICVQSLHHFHRRDEVFRALGRAVRPGGRLYLLEPHHNLRRAGRLLRKYLTSYRRREFWTDERNWATHDFMTRGELRRLCRIGGFGDVRLSGYWIPFTRRLLPDPRRRVALERRLGRLPVLRHWAAVLGVEATRTAEPPGHG